MLLYIFFAYFATCNRCVDKTIEFTKKDTRVQKYNDCLLTVYLFKVLLFNNVGTLY